MYMCVCKEQKKIQKAKCKEKKAGKKKRQDNPNWAI